MTYTITKLLINPERNKNVKKSSLYGFLGTALSCIILFLVMWFYIMPYSSVITEPAEEEGLMISFGDNENAGGMGNSSEPLAAPESETLAPAVVAVPKNTPAPVRDQIITQNVDNSNAIFEKKQKEQERRQQEQLEKQRIETENRLAQQRKKEQDATNRANATVNGLFSNGSLTSGTGNGKGSGNGTGSGSGNGSESGIQGNPAGHGNLGGNTYSLNGRSLTGRLISPTYDKDVEGKITVSIRVDESGKVASASIGSPTTISDTETRNAALMAAKNTRFSAGNGVVSGKIVYNFKLK